MNLLAEYVNRDILREFCSSAALGFVPSAGEYLDKVNTGWLLLAQITNAARYKKVVLVELVACFCE